MLPGQDLGWGPSVLPASLAQARKWVQLQTWGVGPWGVALGDGSLGCWEALGGGMEPGASGPWRGSRPERSLGMLGTQRAGRSDPYARRVRPLVCGSRPGAGVRRARWRAARGRRRRGTSSPGAPGWEPRLPGKGKLRHAAKPVLGWTLGDQHAPHSP